MKRFPPIPRVEDAPAELLDRGHLWIQEKVDGAHLRFRLLESGLVRFGGRDRVFDEVPEPYRHAARHVRERLDREALREAVGDVEGFVFFGEAMHRRAIDYDWATTPSFLGFDVWSAERGEFLPPDSVEKIYRRLGLRPVNTFRKEVRASDFDPESYEIPDSNWYDGPAAGVILRTKTGERAKLLRPDFREAEEPEPVDASAEELAREYATDRRFERLADDLRERDRPVTFDALYDRVTEDVVRENNHQLFRDDRDLDFGAFRSELAALTREYVEERR